MNMSKIYGYCRISTAKQSIERQERNIKAVYADAIIVKEVFTGTQVDGRVEWDKIYKKVNAGDTIVFDSVSRMSRNATEGVELYMELFNKGVNLVFLKESYINTEVYKSTIEQTIGATGNDIADIYIEATNKVIKLLAEKQIIKAFEQAEKEVQDLRQRTREGIETARLNGKQIGREDGSKVTTKKSVEMKEKIRKMAKSFDGNMTDKEVIETLGIARNTYFKYKKEMKEADQK
jgi:DNA invertase Pin-like site-specific DNA recombinase